MIGVGEARRELTHRVRWQREASAACAMGAVGRAEEDLDGSGRLHRGHDGHRWRGGRGGRRQDGALRRSRRRDPIIQRRVHERGGAVPRIPPLHPLGRRRLRRRWRRRWRWRRRRRRHHARRAGPRARTRAPTAAPPAPRQRGARRRRQSRLRECESLERPRVEQHGTGERLARQLSQRAHRPAAKLTLGRPERQVEQPVHRRLLMRLRPQGGGRLLCMRSACATCIRGACAMCTNSA